MSMEAGVLVVQRDGSYKDIPGVRYHFPKAAYLERIKALQDSLVLIYEPRRGGTSRSSGGRMGFVAFAFVDDIWDDPTDHTHAFLSYRMYTELVNVVPLSVTSLQAKAMQNAVRPIAYAEAEEVVWQGLRVRPPLVGVREGLVDAEALLDLAERRTREIVTNRAIRDSTFRYRVIEQAYRGRCAITGARMTNGHGRAEVDAAHIRPVESKGPDVTSNGLALMKSMHWAFDRGLIALSDTGRILTVTRGIDPVILRMLPEGREAFLPSERSDRPHPTFLEWHRQNVFKGSADVV